MKFDTDLSTVDSGVWTPPDEDGSEFLVAHTSNLKFQRALARLQLPHRRKIEAGTMDPGQNRDIVCRAMAEGVLLGWRGVASKDGAVEYSIENAFTLLKRSTELRDIISDFAMNLSNFRQTEVDEVGEGSSIG